MEYKDTVSIIIPVYNAEKYLRNCIDSILNQTYKNIELILVDDGSTDNSGLICDEYEKNDYRIRVIHQENSGPSVARNTGVNAAMGKYVQFVDSDDSIETNMTNRLVEAMNNTVQLALCGYKTIEINNRNTNIREFSPLIQGIYENNVYLKYFGELYTNNLINPLWNKLYSTQTIRKFNIQFIEDLNMGEDLLYNLEYIQVCRKISIINDPLYNYLIFNNNNSLTEGFKKDLFENQQILFQKVREFLLKNNSYKEKNKDIIEETYTYSIINCFNNIFHKDSSLTSKNREKQIKNIIFDDYVNRDIEYFKKGNVQKRLVGCLIKNKSIKGIYSFFKIKNVLRYQLKPIFNLLKSLNNGVNSSKDVSL